MNGNMSQYRIFAETAETGSISGAARRLYISQPAVSKSISSLEESMGCELFIRGSRGVRLTDEGEILYRHVSEAFRYLEAGESELRRYHDLGIGHLSIGASTTLCRYKLLPYLREFSKKYPHISLGINCQPTIQTLELIYDGTIDIGLIARQDNMKNIEFCHVGEIQDIFVATPDYLQNLAIRENSADIRKLAEKITSCEMSDHAESTCMQPYHDRDEICRLLNISTLILLNKGNATRQFIDYYLEENHIHPVNMIEITTMDLLIEFARTGLGIACVIEEFVRDDLQSGRLVRIPAGHELKAREIGFAWNEEKAPHQSIDTFRKFIGA